MNVTRLQYSFMFGSEKISTREEVRQALLALMVDLPKRPDAMNITDFFDFVAFRTRSQGKVSYERPGPPPLVISPYTKSIGSTKEKLPKAIIHIGPRKGGSTTIQARINEYSQMLLEDANLLLLGSSEGLLPSDCNSNDQMKNQRKKKIGHHTVAKCLFYYEHSENCTGVIPQMESEIEEAKQMGKGIIFSSESLDAIDKIDSTKIQALFAGFEVHIVVVYRRFFEWIVSLWGERYKKRGRWNQWSHNISDVVSYLSRTNFLMHHIPILPEIRFYRQAGFQVHLLNFHSPGDHGDISKALLCSELMEAPKVCDKVLTEKVVVARKGPTSTAYDEIAVAAERAGLLDKKSISRPEARNQLQQHFEETLKMVESDFPKKCIQGQPLELLQNISEVVESIVMPEYYEQKGKRELSDHFETYKRTKFCSVDTEKLLSQKPLHSVFNGNESLGFGLR